MEYTTFKEKQEKIMEKRRQEKEKKEIEEKQRKEMEDANNKDEITSFFKENKEVIINATLDSFMKELNATSLPPYKVEYKLETSLYFGYTQNEYNVFLEDMIKEELKRKTEAIGQFEVSTTIVAKKNDYYSGVTWNRMMIISISLNF